MSFNTLPPTEVLSSYQDLLFFYDATIVVLDGDQPWILWEDEEGEMKALSYPHENGEPTMTEARNLSFPLRLLYASGRAIPVREPMGLTRDLYQHLEDMADSLDDSVPHEAIHRCIIEAMHMTSSLGKSEITLKTDAVVEAVRLIDSASNPAEEFFREQKLRAARALLVEQVDGEFPG